MARCNHCQRAIKTTTLCESCLNDLIQWGNEVMANRGRYTTGSNNRTITRQLTVIAPAPSKKTHG